MKESSPNVFISYSWSGREYEEFILGLAERLVSDGVYVIIDKWDLSPGDDKYAYMERIVTDHTIDKIIVASDKRYTEKANSRYGGVGDEAQIISRELYRNIADSRIIPIVTELDGNGSSYLPVYLKSRIYIEYLFRSNVEAGYEALLREIYDSPLYTRPPIGSTPTTFIKAKPAYNQSYSDCQQNTKNSDWCIGEGENGLNFVQTNNFRPIFYEPHKNIWIGVKDRYGWSICYDKHGGAKHLRSVNARPIFYDPQTSLWIGVKDRYRWLVTYGYNKGIDSIKESNARPIFYCSETKMWIGVKDNIGWTMCSDSHGGAKYLKSKSARPIFYSRREQFWIGIKDNIGWKTTNNPNELKFSRLFGSKYRPIYFDYKSGLWLCASK